MDQVAKTYIKMRLDEMAYRQDNMQSMLSTEHNRKLLYSTISASANNIHHKELDSGAMVVKHVSGNKTAYHTLDHDKNEVIHKSVISREATIHGDAEYNESVDRDQTNDKLPKGHAADLTYEHFMKSDVPFRTADVQSPNGHKMWRGMVDRALTDQHHVYFSNNGKLQSVTHENKNEVMSAYYGKHLDAHRKHIILSKTPLK